MTGLGSHERKCPSTCATNNTYVRKHTHTKKINDQLSRWTVFCCFYGSNPLLTNLLGICNSATTEKYSRLYVAFKMCMMLSMNLVHVRVMECFKLVNCPNQLCFLTKPSTIKSKSQKVTQLYNYTNSKCLSDCAKQAHS